MRLITTTLLLLFSFCLSAQNLFETFEIPRDGQNSRGVAWGDLNGDHWPEIVVANTAPEEHTTFNVIYLNLEGKGFKMEALDQNHLWTEGIYLIDVDNDDDLDIFCSTEMEGVNQLYINNGAGQFQGVDAGDLTSDVLNSPGSCWCDYDLDGDLDAFVLGKELEDDMLYINGGNLKFTKHEEGPWVGKNNEARACIWGDFDGDNRPDIYINNYIIRENGQYVAKHRNYLYLNKSEGFEEITDQDLVTTEQAGYGVSVVDLESDGDLDIYVSNISMSDDNAFYRNDGKANFETVRDLEISTYLRRPSKGHFWADLNLDGLLDIYQAVGTMGAPVPYPEIQNYLLMQRPDSTFNRIYDDPSVLVADVSAGTAGGDFDLDGDIDIMVANWLEGANNNRFYINQAADKNWIKLRLRGIESNAYGIGSWVTITTSDQGLHRVQRRYHYPITGYGSMSEPIVHFGLEKSDIVLKVEIRWPNGNIDLHHALDTNKYYMATEGRGIDPIN